MPSVQIYLNEELFEFIKADKSRMVQQALKELQDKQQPKPPPSPVPPAK